MALCDENVYNGTDNWGQQIGCLRKEIEALQVEIKGATRETTNFTNTLGKSGSVMKDMLNTIGDMRKRMATFTTSTSQQYQLAEKIAKSYKEAGLSIGLAVNRAGGFNQAFKGSVAEVARFGGEISDVQRIYEEFADSSGRVRILGKDEVKNIFQLGKAANLVGSEATNLYETLELMGVSNVDATERLQQVIIDSQNIGLNSSKVMKVLSSNMDKMSTYSFSNGVKGMTEMAKLAVKMRMDVGEMLGMAGKFYEPEAAIEAAANLQMLGGDIAEAFGDPFETMYLARNKPEELAEKVGTMVENMMTFNEETGQYEFPAEARMQLQAAGEQLGINVDSMIEMTRQSAKMKDVKDKLSMKGMFSEEEMDGIASIARMEGGEFKVDVYNEDNEKITKSIDELTSSDMKMLMIPPKDEEDYMTKMIDNSMTTNELLESIEDTFQKTFVEGLDVYEIYEQSSKETVKATRDLTMATVESSISGMKDTLIGEIGGIGEDTLKKTDQAMADYLNTQTDFLNDVSEIEAIVENGNITITNAVTASGRPDQNIPDTEVNLDAEKAACNAKTDHTWNGSECIKITEDLMALPGSNGRVLTGKFGSIGLDDRDMVISGDPKKLMGGKSSGTPSKMEFGNLNITGRIEIVSPDGSAMNMNMSSLKPQIEKMIISHMNGTFREGGVPSSKQSTDYMG